MSSKCVLYPKGPLLYGAMAPNQELLIHGCPIALIYWKDVYTAKSGISWKPSQWKGIKGKWFEWKVSVYKNLASFSETHAYGNVQILVQHWRKGSLEEFWSEFSENGKRLQSNSCTLCCQAHG